VCGGKGVVVRAEGASEELPLFFKRKQL
jgi:hypothetical protein